MTPTMCACSVLTNETRHSWLLWRMKSRSSFFCPSTVAEIHSCGFVRPCMHTYDRVCTHWDTRIQYQMYVQTRTYNPPTYVHTYAHTYTYAYTRTLIHTYTHTHTHTHILHTCTYTYTYAYTYTYTYTHAYTHAHIHIHTYTYTHTHIHTYTHALIDCYHAFPGKYTKPHETTTKPPRNQSRNHSYFIDKSTKPPF